MVKPQALQQSPAPMLPSQGGGSSLRLLHLPAPRGRLSLLGQPNLPRQPSPVILGPETRNQLVPGTVTAPQLSDYKLKIQDSVTGQVCTSSVLENAGCFYAFLQQYLLHQTFTRISIKCRELDNFVNDSKSATSNQNTTQWAKF